MINLVTNLIEIKYKSQTLSEKLLLKIMRVFIMHSEVVDPSTTILKKRCFHFSFNIESR